MIFQGYVAGIGYALLCILISGILYKLGVPKEYTRKIVHILVGAEWFILNHFFGPGIHFLIVCVLFLIFLAIAYRTKMLEMISSDKNNAPGTVYYAFAMTVVALVCCFVPKLIIPFGIGVLCTSVGDGLAGVVGKLLRRGNPRIYNEKTLFGAVVNFVTSTGSAYLISHLYSLNISFFYCLAIGLLSTELELVTGYGLDNISITWVITAFAYAIIYVGGVENYILPILLSLVIFAVARKKNALTTGGIIAAICVDIIISVSLGNMGFLVLSAFFVCSIIIDKIKKRAKKQGRDAKEAKGDKRDAMQVFVNGAPACVAAVAFFVSGKSFFIVAFVAALAEAFADTAASGIGAFSKRVYDPFRFKKCENGLSGGMSVLGTLSSLLAAFIVALIPLVFDLTTYDFRIVIIVSVSAFFGAVFDSFLGSVFQVKYQCRKCGAITERIEHCGIATIRYRGFSAIDNDIVNILSSAFTAILATAWVIVF